MTDRPDNHYAQFDALNNLGDLLEQFAPKKVLLVTGRGSFEACGAKAIVEKHLPENVTIRFSEFEVNPRLEDGLSGRDLVKDEDIDLILAIGGGSVLDMAKLIKALLATDGDPIELVSGNISMGDKGPRLIAVPTTAGSGSESTHFAVVYIGKEKFSLAAPGLLPDANILDGALLKSTSPYQRAINGLDALAQAIEGSWAAGSTEENRGYGFEAIELLMHHLPRIIENPQNEDLQAVMHASNLAGKTINISKTTSAHAFSYAFTSYHDVAHGHAVWLTLPRIFDIHLKAASEAVTDPRGESHLSDIMQRLHAALAIPDGDSAAKFLRDFMQNLGVEPDMKKLGATPADQRSFLSKQVNLQRFANNPVAIGEKEVEYIFEL